MTAAATSPRSTASTRRQALLAIAASAAAGLAAPLSAASAPAIGNRAPDFDLPGMNGQPIRLSALTGKLVYLDFWASWCGPCRQSFPWMNDLHEQLRERGLHVLAINVDAKRTDAMRFLADTRASFELAFDPAGDSPRAYGVRAMPTSCIIDRTGTVAAIHAGFTPSRAATTRREIEAMLKVS